MAASNTTECMKECVGRRIVGVLFDVGRSAEYPSKTFIFEDGTGFSFASNGSFWQEPSDKIATAINRHLNELRALEATKREILAAAGILADEAGASRE